MAWRRKFGLMAIIVSGIAFSTIFAMVAHETVHLFQAMAANVSVETVCFFGMSREVNDAIGWVELNGSLMKVSGHTRDEIEFVPNAITFIAAISIFFSFLLFALKNEEQWEGRPDVQ